MAQLIKNTNQEFHCTNCGSTNASIVREAADPRVKCNDCNFMFNGSDSKAAEEAGAIPDGPPELADPIEIQEPTSETREGQNSVLHEEGGGSSHQDSIYIPRKPDYVFISKTRQRVEYVTKKNFKKTALKWEAGDTNYDLFLLTPQKVESKVELT